MAGISIEFVSNVSSLIRGTRDVEQALDRNSDALDDLAREAQQAGQATGDALADGADEGGRAVEGLERSFRDMVRSANRAADDVGDGFRDGYRDAERAARDFERTADDASDEAADATGEFKDEARSNFSEVASSFSGDMTSAADLVQGTLGGLAGSLAGPAGLAAGALAIIGGTLFSSVNENAEKAEQRVADMYDDFLESGAEFLSKDYIAREIAKIYQGAEDAAINIGRLRDLATSADLPEPLLARALVGDEAARAEVSRQIAAKRLEITDALDDATKSGQNLAPAYTPAIEAMQDITDELDGVAGAAATAQENAKNAAEAIAGIDASRAAASAEEARGKYDGLGRAITSLPRDHTVTFHADTREWEAAVGRMRAAIAEIDQKSGDARRGAITDARYAAQEVVAEALAQQRRDFSASRGGAPR